MMPETEKWLPDANTILRYLLNDDVELTAKATEFWESVREGKRTALLREGVLLECVYVLQRFYKVPRVSIAVKLRALLAYKGLLATEADILDQSLELYGRETLDYVDCLLFTSALRDQGRLFSFDKKLNRLMTSAKEGFAEP